MRGWNELWQPFVVGGGGWLVFNGCEGSRWLSIHYTNISPPCHNHHYSHHHLSTTSTPRPTLHFHLHLHLHHHSTIEATASTVTMSTTIPPRSPQFAAMLYLHHSPRPLPFHRCSHSHHTTTTYLHSPPFYHCSHAPPLSLSTPLPFHRCSHCRHTTIIYLPPPPPALHYQYHHHEHHSNTTTTIIVAIASSASSNTTTAAATLYLLHHTYHYHRHPSPLPIPPQPSSPTCILHSNLLVKSLDSVKVLNGNNGRREDIATWLKV
ncbi:hypothetical protein Acr_09g0006930 [Actinidia rufa]|uniref:Uncharacterized protein n=1 Tax=Actinidia rufa TaxID=165716 RepID=A0A7J0F8J7_9ERIC|nr:hypothetical protein Acr_09g0006930 [Actinidia rufa]